MTEKVECCICGKEVEKLEQFNGEQMCDVCYQDEENQIF